MWEAGWQRTDSINLVEYLPLFVRNPQLLRCLDGSSQLARPHLQIWQFVLLDEISQGVGELGCERDGEYFCFIRFMFGGRTQENGKRRGLSVIKVMTQVFLILQLSTPYPTELSPWERLVIRFSEDAGFAVHKMRITKENLNHRTCLPRGESSESPPMRPSTLWLLSPCRHR